MCQIRLLGFCMAQQSFSKFWNKINPKKGKRGFESSFVWNEKKKGSVKILSIGEIYIMCWIQKIISEVEMCLLMETLKLCSQRQLFWLDSETSVHCCSHLKVGRARGCITAQWRSQQTQLCGGYARCTRCVTWGHSAVQQCLCFH